jgi:importin subunit beta-1
MFLFLKWFFCQCVIRKLNAGIQPLADRIMTLILQLIQAAGKTSTVLEDAFLVVGSLASGQNASVLFHARNTF